MEAGLGVEALDFGEIDRELKGLASGSGLSRFIGLVRLDLGAGLRAWISAN